ncbi:MAG TPA: hypothetical protein VKV20_13615 [Ktedonobacteraceae bacterium]|jgi:hypothetical protein|nr:hypothetical protein [Ktedonobacteraceae bacterium]
MGIYLSQLPPAELARLKAELAETLIANFCYPRFFDYRTNSLRMRPVDRTKRQEVWLFLGNMDFTTWNRIDLLSPEFQRQVERLFIHFVQRNRNFFGEQGRKRMADVKMLINTSSQAVTEGFRGHLTRRQATNPPFGSPRPISSWSTTNVSGQPELKWEQIVSGTMLLQQQLQEARGEIKPSLPGEAHPAVTTPGRAPGSGATANGHASRTNGSVESGARPAAPQKAAHLPQPQQPPVPQLASLQRIEARLIEDNKTVTPATPGPKTTNPLAPPSGPLHMAPEVPARPAVESAGAPVVPGLQSSSKKQDNHVIAMANTPLPGAPAHNVARATPPIPQTRPVEAPHSPAVPEQETVREVSRTLQPAQSSIVEVPSKQPGSATVILSDEDIVIFEQLSYQLLMWLRVEAVHAGLEISGQGAGQLLEILKQQGELDETHLQVISTLLNICNQVIANGHANVLDYKQAMMFYLMHTRRYH